MSDMERQEGIRIGRKVLRTFQSFFSSLFRYFRLFRFLLTSKLNAIERWRPDPWRPLATALGTVPPRVLIFMSDRITKLREDFDRELKAVNTDAGANALRDRWVGRKSGIVTAEMKTLSGLRRKSAAPP